MNINSNKKKLTLSILPDVLFEKSLAKLISYEWGIWNRSYIKPIKRYICEMCGADTSFDKRHYHGHERYTIDHDRKIVIFEEVRHLCSKCHYTYHLYFASINFDKEKQAQLLKHIQYLDSYYDKFDTYEELINDFTEVHCDVRIIYNGVYYDLSKLNILEANKYVMEKSNNTCNLNMLLDMSIDGYKYDVTKLPYYELLQDGLELNNIPFVKKFNITKDLD